MILLSSLFAGLIASAVMLMSLYIPMLWNCDYCDVLNAIGLVMKPKSKTSARLFGIIPYLLVGVLFAIVYGWFTLSLMKNVHTLNLPQLLIFPESPISINLVFPLLGLVVGLGQGVIAALLVTILVIEHHPLERFHNRYTLVFSQVASHLIFGMVVMLAQSLFLQVLGTSIS